MTISESIVTLGTLAGGLGLFLLAVAMITDGLKLAAGNTLRDILGKWTRSPMRGVVTGLSVTAVVQSSSAVTIAIIGFVNAGLITMYQALGVVFGANIGTTMTGWLVTIVGFKLKVELFALPLIGIGMVLRLTGNNSLRAPLGTALVGFGLFFIGIDVLKDAFEGLAAAIDLRRFTAHGVLDIFVFVAIGFAMTVLTQSSSAAIAITLTAATGGVLGLYAAAAMVIGANVGTTSTAAFAVIGATPNAKRVASAHVIFNLATGVVALLSLPLLFLVVRNTGRLLGLEDIPAVTLALFHTIFNILGVLLMWPVTGRLARFLEKRFVTTEEVEGQPQYLDRTVAVSPALAINALTLELGRIASIVRRMALTALSTESGQSAQMNRDHIIVETLTASMADFIAHLEKGLLTSEVAQQITKLLRAEQHLLASAEQALEVAKEQPGLKPLADAELEARVARYRSAVATLMQTTDFEQETFSIAACETQLERVQASYEEVKEALLFAGAELRGSIPGLIELIEQNSRIRRMARQMVKAVRSLGGMESIGEPADSEDDEAGGPPPPLAA